VVLALVALAGWAARLRAVSAGVHLEAGVLRLRATLALDAHRRLHLVETDRGTVLVLVGGTHDVMVSWPQA
jgi:hypothetical protein